MSSSPPSAPPTIKGHRRQLPTFTSLPCPTCGSKSLVAVMEDCALSGGRLVKGLRHIRCKSCGERYFDVAAMAMIEAAGKPSTRKRLA
jgi:ribosomal protein L37E